MNSPKYIRSLTAISTQPNSLTNLDNDFLPKISPVGENECPICLTDYSSYEMLEVCSQGHKFCKACLQFFLSSKVTELGSKTIPCPQDSCKSPFNEKILKSVLDEKTFKLYEQKKQEKMVSLNPRMKFCPQAGCSRVYKPSQSKSYTICKCHSKICNACGNLWHEEKACWQVVDQEFQVFQKANDVKFCVMCKTVVQKVEGCSHITCPVCDYDWCWLCGREFTSYHAATCPKQWKPEPPAIVANEPNKEGSPKETSKTKKLIFLILTLPFRLVFFAFFPGPGELWRAIKNADKKVVKVALFILGLIISFAYDALLFAIFTADDNEQGDAFGKVFVGLIFLIPFFIYVGYEIWRIYHVANLQNAARKRWMSRNAETFGYNKNSRANIPTAGSDITLNCVQSKVVTGRQNGECDIFQGNQCKGILNESFLDLESGGGSNQKDYKQNCGEIPVISLQKQMI